MLLVSLVSITSPIGLAIAGPVGDRVGLQVWYVIAALLCAGISLICCFVPALLRIEENDHRQATDAPAATPAVEPAYQEAL